MAAPASASRLSSSPRIAMTRPSRSCAKPSATIPTPAPASARSCFQGPRGRIDRRTGSVRARESVEPESDSGARAARSGAAVARPGRGRREPVQGHPRSRSQQRLGETGYVYRIADSRRPSSRAGQPGAAAVQAREAVRFDPGNAEAHNLLGVALASQGVYAEAAQEFRQTLRLDPTHHSARNNMERALAMSRVR